MMDLFDRSLPERFWDKIIPEPNSGCWLWTGSTNEKGYATFSWHGKPITGHKLTFGPVSEGLERDHKCRIRSCVNPHHIEAVTHQINLQRRARKERCLRGHPLSGDNIYKTGACKTCARARAMAQYYKAPGF